MLVELACSATLAIGYQPNLLSEILPELKPSKTSTDAKAFIRPQSNKQAVVFIACGGAKVGIEDVESYRQELGLLSSEAQLKDSHVKVEY